MESTFYIWIMLTPLTDFYLTAISVNLIQTVHEMYVCWIYIKKVETEMKSQYGMGLSFPMKSEKNYHINLNTFLFFSQRQRWIRTKVPVKRSALEAKEGAQGFTSVAVDGKRGREAWAGWLSSYLEYTALSSHDFSNHKAGIHVTLK